MRNNSKPKAYTLNLRATALIVSIFFTFSTFLSVTPPVYAGASDHAEKSIFTTLNTEMTLPAEFGEVKEVFAADSKDFVVLIQDAHAIPDAQANIRNIIEHLQVEYGIGFVGVEGAANKLDAQIFKSFPDQEVLEDIFQRYHEAGELTGANAAALFSKHPSVYHGLEDWDLYEKGFIYFLQGMDAERELLTELTKKEEALLKKKKEAYSQTILRLDSALTQFEMDSIGLIELLSAFAEVEMPEAGSELRLLLDESKKQPQQTESHISEVRALAKEAQRLMRRKGRAEDQMELNQKVQLFQTSSLAPRALALEIKRLSDKFKLKIEVSQTLLASVEQERRMQDIKGSAVYYALEKYTDEVLTSLFENESQEALYRETLVLKVQKKLIQLELTYEDWSRLQQEGPIENDPLLVPHFNFYTNAVARDRVIFENIKKHLNHRNTALQSKHHAAIAVAGGFHTEGLTRYFRANQISYVLITPQINQLPSINHYRDHMKGFVSWKDFIEVEGGAISPYKAFVRGTREKLIQATDSSTQIVKRWRDQIIRDLADDGRITEAGNYTRFIEGSQLVRVGSSDFERRLEQFDIFVNGLKRLHAENSVTTENVLNLFQPAGSGDAATYAVFDSSARLGGINMTSGGFSPRPQGIVTVSASPVKPDGERAEVRAGESQALAFNQMSELMVLEAGKRELIKSALVLRLALTELSTDGMLIGDFTLLEQAWDNPQRHAQIVRRRVEELFRNATPEFKDLMESISLALVPDKKEDPDSVRPSWEYLLEKRNAVITQTHRAVPIGTRSPSPEFQAARDEILGAMLVQDRLEATVITQTHGGTAYDIPKMMALLLQSYGMDLGSAQALVSEAEGLVEKHTHDVMIDRRIRQKTASEYPEYSIDWIDMRQIALELSRQDDVLNSSNYKSRLEQAARVVADSSYGLQAPLTAYENELDDFFNALEGQLIKKGFVDLETGTVRPYLHREEGNALDKLRRGLTSEKLAGLNLWDEARAQENLDDYLTEVETKLRAESENPEFQKGKYASYAYTGALDTIDEIREGRRFSALSEVLHRDLGLAFDLAEDEGHFDTHINILDEALDTVGPNAGNEQTLLAAREAVRNVRYHHAIVDLRSALVRTVEAPELVQEVDESMSYEQVTAYLESVEDAIDSRRRYPNISGFTVHYLEERIAAIRDNFPRVSISFEGVPVQVLVPAPGKSVDTETEVDSTIDQASALSDSAQLERSSISKRSISSLILFALSMLGTGVLLMLYWVDPIFSPMLAAAPLYLLPVAMGTSTISTTIGIMTEQVGAVVFKKQRKLSVKNVMKAIVLSLAFSGPFWGFVVYGWLFTYISSAGFLGLLALGVVQLNVFDPAGYYISTMFLGNKSHSETIKNMQRNLSKYLLMGFFFWLVVSYLASNAPDAIIRLLILQVGTFVWNIVALATYLSNGKFLDTVIKWGERSALKLGVKSDGDRGFIKKGWISLYERLNARHAKPWYGPGVVGVVIVLYALIFSRISFLAFQSMPFSSLVFLSVSLIGMYFVVKNYDKLTVDSDVLPDAAIARKKSNIPGELHDSERSQRAEVRADEAVRSLPYNQMSDLMLAEAAKREIIKSALISGSEFL